MKATYVVVGVLIIAAVIFITMAYETQHSFSKPLIKDPGLKAQPIELVFEGISFPSSFIFLGHDDILLLEKDTGKVRRITNGQMLEEPLLDVNVATYAERGLLGIATTVSNNHTYVFLYYTETNSTGGSDVGDGAAPIGNRLYRYELLDNKLVDPKLLLDLPAVPGRNHVGGAITIGPDSNIYLTVGDVDHRTEAQNIEGGKVNGTGGILRITQDGKPVKDPETNKYILGDTFPLSLYYAYGIRNSFGIDFDPVTGNLWDTENGPNFGDEINLVEPGFNSGWIKIQGIWEPNGDDRGRIITEPHNLVDFEGKGKYSEPEFIWEYPVGPSDLIFFNSSNFGSMYENDLFVGNVNQKALYHFDMNGDRTGLDLHGKLNNRIAEKVDDTKEYILGGAGKD